ncbi:hypothetical protein [Nostoc sp.]
MVLDLVICHWSFVIGHLPLVIGHFSYAPCRQLLQVGRAAQRTGSPMPHALCQYPSG